jgi:DNA polymerase I-like protein with 3'-5' exonuclease and polymerase domains
LTTFIACDKIKEKWERVLNMKIMSIDTETTGLQFWKDKIFGISVSYYDVDKYWDIRTCDQSQLKLKLNDAMDKAEILVFHNAKFDIHFLREWGVNVPMDKVNDTMIRAALINEHRFKYDLDSLGADYLGSGKNDHIYTELAAMFGGNTTRAAQMKNLHKAPVQLVEPYAKRDTRLTLDLWHVQESEIKSQELERVQKLEMDLLPVLVDMERRGVKVDIDKAAQSMGWCGKEIDQQKQKLNDIAGFNVNPNPSGSIHKLFEPKQNKSGAWVLIDGTPAPSTNAGKASINADVLRVMKHPAAALILDVRKLMKMKDTFLKGHILGHHDNGIIHANFNQTKGDNDAGTGTGRLSVNNPALQQIPKRDKKIAAIVRSIFIPDAGQVWNCTDWSQMDFRIFAHYLNDPIISKQYDDNPDSDFHQIAADITGLPRSPRYSGDANAKQINLGLVFGMGSGTMAEKMGLPYTWSNYNGHKYKKPGQEAEAVFNKYHSAIPGVKSLLNRASSVAKSRGYVKTVMGRRLRFPGGQFVHKAGGLVFQGSAADALKVKLVEIHDMLKGTEGRLLLNVHDEFDLSLPKGGGFSDKITEVVHDFGKNSVINFNIPIRSSSGKGKNWWKAC